MRNYNKKYKQKSSLENSKNELKLTFKQLNEQYNFFVLQILSKKMKELINKYKEKIFEISDISKIYKNYQRKQNNESNNDLSHEYFSINSKNKNNQNNNNSNNNTQNSLLISQIKNKKNYHNLLELVQKEINENKITDTLLRELINIKETLQQSSFEINQIFKYPLSLLKIKFSMEQIQLEAFNKILVKDELISTLLFQIKVLFQNSHNKKFLEYVSIIEDDKNYTKNEMVKFDQLLEEKLKNKNLINSINNINNNNNPSFLYNNSNSTKAQSDICDDEMSNGSNEEIIIKQNFNNYRKNILTNSVSSTQSQSNSNGNNQNLEGNNNNEEEMKFVDKNIDIDTLVKIIDSQEDICSHKKKKKKKNKNKNKKTLNNINLGVKIFNNNDNNISKNNNNNINYLNNNNSFNNLNNSKNDESDFENVFKDFKEDITKNSLYIYETNKMKCNISSNFLLKLFTKK